MSVTTQVEKPKASFAPTQTLSPFAFFLNQATKDKRLGKKIGKHGASSIGDAFTVFMSGVALANDLKLLGPSHGKYHDTFQTATNRLSRAEFRLHELGLTNGEGFIRDLNKDFFDANNLKATSDKTGVLKLFDAPDTKIYKLSKELELLRKGIALAAEFEKLEIPKHVVSGDPVEVSYKKANNALEAAKIAFQKAGSELGEKFVEELQGRLKNPKNTNFHMFES